MVDGLILALQICGDLPIPVGRMVVQDLFDSGKQTQIIASLGVIIKAARRHIQERAQKLHWLVARQGLDHILGGHYILLSINPLL